MSEPCDDWGSADAAEWSADGTHEESAGRQLEGWPPGWLTLGAIRPRDDRASEPVAEPAGGEPRMSHTTHFDGSPCTWGCPWGSPAHRRYETATLQVSVATTDGDPPFATWEVTVLATDLAAYDAREAVFTLARQLTDEEEALSAAQCDVCASPIHNGRCVNCGQKPS